MTKNSCPIWNTPATIKWTRRDGSDVNSPRAGGNYFISGIDVFDPKTGRFAVKVINHFGDEVMKAFGV